MANEKKIDNTKVLAGGALGPFVAELYKRSGSKPVEGARSYAPATEVVAVRFSDENGVEAVARVTGVATMRGATGGTFVSLEVVSGDLFERGTRIQMNAGEAVYDAEILDSAVFVAEVLASLGLPAPDLSGNDLPERKAKVAEAEKPNPAPRQGMRIA